MRGKYDTIKKKHKDKKRDNRQEKYKTGGGVEKVQRLSDTEERVDNMMANAVHGLECPFDPDYVPTSEVPPPENHTERLDSFLEEACMVEDWTTPHRSQGAPSPSPNPARTSTPATLQLVPSITVQDAINSQPAPHPDWSSYSVHRMRAPPNPALQTRKRKADSATTKLEQLTSERLKDLQQDAAYKAEVHKWIDRTSKEN